LEQKISILIVPWFRINVFHISTFRFTISFCTFAVFKDLSNGYFWDEEGEVPVGDLEVAVEGSQYFSSDFKNEYCLEWLPR